MRLYANWLDGEFVKILSQATGPKQIVRDMIRALKLHALLGTQFLLSDVQIFDSAVIHEFFADRQARDFLRENLDFLGLRVRPDPQFGTDSFSLAARGLTRTQNPRWLSSVFSNDPTPIKLLANEIITEIQDTGYIYLDRPCKAVSAYPAFQEQFEAVRHAVLHFGKHFNHIPGELMAPPVRGSGANYYQVLDDMANNISGQVLQESQDNAKNVINFIDRKIEDPDARKARSRVLSILEHERNPEKCKLIWNNVVQAWNYATQQTVSPDGGSTGALPGAVSPAPFFDSLKDVLVPIISNQQISQMHSIKDPARLSCNVDEITWEQIAKARAATANTTMQKLTEARRNGTAMLIFEALREHCKEVVRFIHPPKNVPPITYVIEVGSIVVGVWGAMPNIPLAVAAGSFGGALLLSPWQQRRAIANTLFKFATGQGNRNE